MLYVYTYMYVYIVCKSTQKTKLTVCVYKL